MTPANGGQIDLAASHNGLLRRFLAGEKLNPETVPALLAPAHFRDERTASMRLRQLALGKAEQAALAHFLPHFLQALNQTQRPDRVLAVFQRFLDAAPDTAKLLHFLAQRPRSADTLVTLFAGSQFLTQILLRHPEYLLRLMDRQALTREKGVTEIVAAAHSATAGASKLTTKMDAWRRYQRWELLRIGLCDLQDFWDLATVTAELSCLAEGMVRVGLEIAAAETNTPPEQFAVLALGKLGGQELNYSSDIDLLFLAADSARPYFRLGEMLIDLLTRTTGEGFLYRVDMRLRPWGRSGPLIATVGGYLDYLQHHAHLWEKQALLKARAIAGNVAMGMDFLRRAEPLVFGHSGEEVRNSVYRMKQRIEEKLERRGESWGEVKRGRGSIRDIEFISQYLQLAYGDRYPDLHTRNTLDALAKLRAHKLIAPEEYLVLTDGYTFLRTVEHHLQLMHNRQTHLLPDNAEEMANLARRLRFQGDNAGGQLVARYQGASIAIHAIYQRYMEESAMTNKSEQRASSPGGKARIERMDISYRETFTPEEMARHDQMAAKLSALNLVQVEAIPLSDGRWQATVVGYDYFGELSLICGLMLAYGLNILAGEIFTSEPAPLPLPTRQRRTGQPSPPRRSLTRRTIVDVLTVHPVQGDLSADTWNKYAADLNNLLHLSEDGRYQEAQGELAKLVAGSLGQQDALITTLHPVDIEIDNESSTKYTILRIDTPDTVGFLYEFTNALSLNNVYVSRVTVNSVGQRVRDELYVTDARGQKITSPIKQQELRAATVLVKHFTHLLPYAPNPESALLHFREFLGQLFRQPNWPDQLASLEQPQVLQTLTRLLGFSEFLWDDFLRMQYANLFPLLGNKEVLAARKPKAALEQELTAALQKATSSEEQRRGLNSFKDREMFRIDMRYILGHTSAYWKFSTELTDLAEVVVAAAYLLCRGELLSQFGEPFLEDGRPALLSICALGKFGGRELGFASDIELMFIYNGDGYTAGPQVITTAKFYERLVQRFLQTVHSKQKGVFEVDLRLRPYGRTGSLAVSLDAFRRYFATDGAAWPYERQALVRLRPVAGDETLGREIVALRNALLYTGEPFNIAAMRAMRERQLRHLVSGGALNAKYSPGGLVDVEYLVQGLQIRHGRASEALRVTNTRSAMVVLAAHGIVPPEDLAQLSRAHTFLRRLIEALRMVRGNARDLTVPVPGSEDFAFLARRLGYSNKPEALVTDLNRHMANVLALRQRLLG